MAAPTGSAAGSSSARPASGSSASSSSVSIGSQLTEIEPLLNRLRDGGSQSSKEADVLLQTRVEAASQLLDIIEPWMSNAAGALTASLAAAPSSSTSGATPASIPLVAHYVRIITTLIQTTLALLSAPGPEVQVPPSQQQLQRHAAAVAQAEAKGPDEPKPSPPPPITAPAIPTLQNAPVSPVFESDAPSQRLRLALVQILHRLLQAPPHAVAHEATRVLAPQMMHTVLEIIRHDNEANAYHAIKTMHDLFRMHKAVLENTVHPFIDLVKSYYIDMHTSLDSTFGSDNSAAADAGAGMKDGTDASTEADTNTQTATATADTPTGSQGPAKAGAGSLAASGNTARQASSYSSPSATVRASASFKILAEIPIALVVLIQTHRVPTLAALSPLIPVLFESCLSLQVPAQRKAHEEAAQRGVIFCGVADGVLNAKPASEETHAGGEAIVNSGVAYRRQVYTDLIVAQVKVMSLIAYVIRLQPEDTKPFINVIPKLCVRLLQDCPPEASSTRKELLVATRHILATDLRKAFVSVLDPALLDPEQKTWVGTGVASREAHRPLTISMLADLVHHVRAELSPALLEKVVYLHAQILHDATLAPSIQTMCAKLLLNLVESVVARCDETKARELLECIMEAFIEKMVGLSALERTLDAAKRYGDRRLQLQQKKQALQRIQNGKGDEQATADKSPEAAESKTAITTTTTDADAQSKVPPAKEAEKRDSESLAEGAEAQEDEAESVTTTRTTRGAAAKRSRDSAASRPRTRRKTRASKQAESEAEDNQGEDAEEEEADAEAEADGDADAQAAADDEAGQVVGEGEASGGGAVDAMAVDSTSADGVADAPTKSTKEVLKEDAMDTDQDGSSSPALEKKADPADAKSTGSAQDVDLQVEYLAIERQKPIASTVHMFDPGAYNPASLAAYETPQPLKDARFLFRNLLFGFKTLLSVLGSRPNSAAYINGETMGRMFREGVRCWALWRDVRDGREEKEVMDHFTNIFLDLSAPIFHEVFTINMDFYFEHLLDNNMLLGVAQNLLSNETASKRFCTILLKFLIAQLDKLGAADTAHAGVTVRLFRMAFMSVTLFPEENESVLQPHLTHLIMHSLKLAARSPESAHYFMILRALFRSIGGGRFEQLYKDVLPLLPILLENLHNLLSTADPNRRELFVDLTLTVPVRLSVLLPYLNYLMKPLVYALQASPDLVNQGLRTLELCIDNLTSDYFDPIMQPYIHDIMKGLWAHLMPLPYNHQQSHATMRILGKMGGRNRKMLQDAPRLEYIDVGSGTPQSAPPTFTLHFFVDEMAATTAIKKAESHETVKSVAEASQNLTSDYGDEPSVGLSTSTAAEAAATGVHRVTDVKLAAIAEIAMANIQRSDDTYRRSSFSLLKHVAVLLLERAQRQSEAERDDWAERIIISLFQSTRADDLKVDATNFLLEIAEWVFSFEIYRPMPLPQGSHARQLLPLTSHFLDGLAQTPTSADSAHAPGYLKIMDTMIDNARKAASLESSPPTRPEIFFTITHAMTSRFCTHCYDPLWARKTGGWLGVNTMVRRKDLGRMWMRDHQLEIIRALLFMLKDMPSEPPSNRSDIVETMLLVVRLANTPEGGSVKPEPEATPEKAIIATPANVPASDGDAADGKDETPSKSEPAAEEKSSEGEVQTPAQAQPDAKVETTENKTQTTTAAELLGRDRHLAALCTLLIVELSSAQEAVRKAVQQAFKVLSEVTGFGITDIMMPVKDRLLQPIFQKPLRALPFGMQIGHIDAVTYALQLRPPLPKFSDELYRVLGEALTLVEADDAQLLGRPPPYKNLLAITDLRVVAIRLLAAAMDCPELSAQRQVNLRMKIIGVYFKSLYSRSEAVVEVAHHSLQQVLQGQAKLPKDVLQTGLRPVLMTLADPSKLTASGLDGLARLLELLTSYFKVEIGGKLFSHMTALANPADLEAAGCGPLQGSQYPDSALLMQTEKRESNLLETLAAITNIFHLLPSAASQFMGSLVPKVCEIEGYLKRSGPTPFTKPIAKYLNRFPEHTATFMFARLEDASIMRCFRLVLASDYSSELRAHLTKEANNLLVPLFEATALPSKTLAVLRLINELLKHDESWMSGQDKLFEAVIAYWRLPETIERRRQESSISSRERRHTIHLINVICARLRTNPSVDAYLDLLDVFTSPTAIDLASLTHFIYEHVAVEGPTAFRREMFQRFMTVFEDRSISQTLKTQMVRVIINPMIFVDVTHGNLRPKSEVEGTEEVLPLFDGPIVMDIVNRIWRPFQTADAVHLCGDDAARIEILHMSTMILEHFSHFLPPQGTARKDAIKFGWANLTADDIYVKNTAYLFIARFLERFESPLKIVGQVYMGLLRTHQLEGRTLVRKALDILIPALPKRVGSGEGGQIPLWAKWTKRQLAEEAHQISQLHLIFSLLVRHFELFYSSREIFVPSIVGSLSKLGFGTQATAETRTLTVDLIELILRWEKLREQRLSSAEDSVVAADGKTRKRGETDGSDGGPRKRARIATGSTDRNEDDSTPSPDAEDAFSISVGHFEMTANYLVRYIAMNGETVGRKSGANRAYLLLKELTATSLWSKAQVKLQIFHRPLVTPFGDDAQQNVVAICNALQALRVVVKCKPDEWVVAQLPELYKNLERSIASDDPTIHDCVRPILDRMFEVIKDVPSAAEDADADGEADADADADGDAEDDPDARAAPQGKPAAVPVNANPSSDLPPGVAELRKSSDKLISESLQNPSRMFSALLVLGSWAKSTPAKIDDYIAPLIKELTRLTKDHLVIDPPQADQRPGVSETNLKLLMLILDILKLRVTQMMEARKYYLSAIVQLVDKSPNVELCLSLLNTVKHWVFELRHEQYPTMKEKAGILLKMISFEKRHSDHLLEQYLGVIYEIYTAPAFARTDLTVRLETAFLLGCRNRQPNIRAQFIQIFDQALVRSTQGRLQYLLGQQSWDYLAEHYWISQVLDLMAGSIDGTRQLLPKDRQAVADSGPVPKFVKTVRGMRMGSFFDSLRKLLYIDAGSAHKVWLAIFPAIWRAIPRKYQEDITRAMIGLLSREYNLRQVVRRPNVVQSLLEGALECNPSMELPPHVTKYLGKTYNSWYTAMELLQNLTRNLPREDDAIREAGQDALSELYAELSEDDMFYGLWRRRCVYAETNAAISYEQNGMWAEAQFLYESAQLKARNGLLAFTEAEYSLWEDHWVICTQKLQQWDLLTDLAKLEGNNDMLLECAWRLSDWAQEKDILQQAIETVANPPTPRRRVFEAYMSLLKAHLDDQAPKPANFTEFSKICDEAIQLSLRKWHALPSIVTQAHIPLLHLFQQFVELQESSTVFHSLEATTLQDLDRRSGELKTQLTTWRERLPNLWDDINLWSDLVAWRQHVFGAINSRYLTLNPPPPEGSNNNSPQYSFTYRGYHEIAWIINRFAHVARKHYLNDVCISSLAKIYTLPNIEIQEAFLKLREQAKCHYKVHTELAVGLDVINNTNLTFFLAPQKAEFYTLKGMFVGKLGAVDEATQCFAQAIQIDYNCAKSWMEWARFNDRQFRDQPLNHMAAANAVTSYLSAAGLHTNSKARKPLLRVLWLLSCDDAQGSAAMAFENFKGEQPIWYWITFIPQLLQSLASREAPLARKILLLIAKHFPQSLYFSLRTVREELLSQRKASQLAAQRQARQAQLQQQQQQQQAQEQQAQQSAETATAGQGNSAAAEQGSDAKPATTSGETPTSTPAPAPAPAPVKAPEGRQDGADASAATPATSSDANKDAVGEPKLTSASPAKPGSVNGPADTKSTPTPQPAPATQLSTNSPAAQNAPVSVSAVPGMTPTRPGQRHPWDLVEEILNLLKTSFPLLALTMEHMTEQIQQRFKPHNDEDIYRLTNALLNDAMGQYIARASSPQDDGELPRTALGNVQKFAENLPPGELKTSFENDFVRARPTMRDYVHRLQRWRDRYEAALDKRSSKHRLDQQSHYLVEFQHQKFDEVEVPGQYLKFCDSNASFSRISRFMPFFDLVRSSGMVMRRLSMMTNKGTIDSFAVQLPSPRYCRREERIFQLLRCFNRVLEKRKETRKRGLRFAAPIGVALSPQLRLLESDAPTVSLQDIFDNFCTESGIGRDDPVMAWVEKMRSTWDHTKGVVEFTNLRMELLDEISSKMVPETVLTNYLTRSAVSSSDLWLLRKRFTLEMASAIFLTYVLFISGRSPIRLHISRASGTVVMSDVVPSFSPNGPQFRSPDPTPFRLTPNIQHFIGPVGIEGVLTASLMALGRTLSEPETLMEDYLSIFVRDEINFWLLATGRAGFAQSEAPRELILGNIGECAKRAKLLSCKFEQDQAKASNSAVPASQSILDLINSASNPSKLAMQDPSWAPWL